MISAFYNSPALEFMQNQSLLGRVIIRMEERRLYTEVEGGGAR